MELKAYKDTVSIYQYPSENQNRTPSFRVTVRYQFINIHQRTKTMLSSICHLYRINLSISIREPKPNKLTNYPQKVSIYQYPSENQNAIVKQIPETTVSIYQYPSENQNCSALLPKNPAVSIYQYPSENQNQNCFYHYIGHVSIYQYPSENQNSGRFAGHFVWYQFINIHQRTKTFLMNCPHHFCINLSISIREPKLS